ncbi:MULTISPECIES: hypothetical protein [unclassified Streptomyces]|uniref:hypothetical protein n=1 Tax=unclassified Streptomyces TaxID=2593676 RepID=UPI0004C86CBE|nr:MULTISPECIES: hypothetical protein [unclassified Streptomyces]
MSAWVRVGWDVALGIAMLMLAFNFHDVAWRFHGYLTNRVGADRLVTPTLIRVIGGVLGAVVLAQGVDRALGG